MGIGTSLGAYFETELDHHAGNEVSVSTLDDAKFPRDELFSEYREDKLGPKEWQRIDENTKQKLDSQAEEAVEFELDPHKWFDPEADRSILNANKFSDYGMALEDYKSDNPHKSLIHKVADIKTSSPFGNYYPD